MRSRDDVQQLPSATRGGQFVLDFEVTMDVPEGWVLLSGGTGAPPPIPGVTSFIELADDEVVVTVVARDFSGGPDRLLDEITGQRSPAAHHRRTNSDLQLPSPVTGRFRCGSDGIEEFFVASLVSERDNAAATVPIGVEVVAAGPTGTITERLPMLRSMVASIGIH